MGYEFDRQTVMDGYPNEERLSPKKIRSEEKYHPDPMLHDIRALFFSDRLPCSIHAAIPLATLPRVGWWVDGCV